MPKHIDRSCGYDPDNRLCQSCPKPYPDRRLCPHCQRACVSIRVNQIILCPSCGCQIVSLPPPDADQDYSEHAELTSLIEWVNQEPASQLVKYVARSGDHKGEIHNLTTTAFRRLTGNTPHRSSLTKDGKHIPYEFTLDQKATELGYDDTDQLQDAVQGIMQARARIKELRGY